MQIITIEDLRFDELLGSLRKAKLIGRYWKNGKVQVVCATNRFMLVSPEKDPSKIAIKPVRSQREAEHLCRRLLSRERERGNNIEVAN